MAAQPEPVTFVLVFNESDLLQYELNEASRPLYVHNYTDIIFLALLLIFAFACNVSLATTVATHRYLRSVPFNRIILSLALMHMVDSLFNGSVAIIYMTRVLWDLGHPVCHLNAFVVQLSLFLVPASLVHAGVLLRTYTYQMTNTRIMAFVCGTWVCAAFAALWLVIDDVVRPYPARMSCGLGLGYLEYATVSLAFNVVLPGIALFAFFGAFVLALIRDRRTKKLLTTRAWSRWSNTLDTTPSDRTPTPLRPDEVRSIYTWLALLVCYVVGFVPYAVHSFSQQMLKPPTNDTRWEICISANVDAFVTWFRFLVTWAHPIAILTLSEELRQETLLMVCWWRHASEDEPVALHATIKPTRHNHQTNLVAQSILGLTRSSNSVGVTNSKTPVLFLGVNGLCLRRPHAEKNETFVQFFCDVISECCVVSRMKMEPKREMEETGSWDVKSYQPLDIPESDGADQRKRRETAAAHPSSRHRLKQNEWPQVSRFSGPRHDMINNRSRSRDRHTLVSVGFDDKRSVRPVSRYISESR